MNNQQYRLPIFPLPVFLLPEGITRLRLFEPRYLKMVGIASKEQGFVICLHKQNTQNAEKKTDIAPHKIWGSWVDIINFGQGKDGLLEIDVKCKALVELHSFDQDKDKLHYANASLLEHWSTTQSQPIPLNTSISRLSKSLINVIKNDDILSELYPKIPTANTTWLIARWLEILPIEQLAKHLFIEEYSLKQAKEFIETIIYK